MQFTKDDFIQAFATKKILPYEDSLIERLRDISYRGIPLSVVVLSFPICNRHCYPTSICLTLGMDYFTLVHGNVNCYPKNQDYPNHSWVERDGYVYDPTDGYRWERDYYYQVYEAEVVEVYDENSVQKYNYYQEFLKETYQQEIPKENLTLILQYLEMLEKESPTVNGVRLLEEIKVCRSRKGITKKLSPQIMKQYQTIMEKPN